MTVAAPRVITRAEVEDFLYHEAALLDEWKLNEWQELLTDDAAYYVPPTTSPKATTAPRCSSWPMTASGYANASSGCSIRIAMPSSPNHARGA